MMTTEIPLVRQFAGCLRRIDPGMDEAVEWAARLVCQAVAEGQVCIDLRRLAGREIEPDLRLPTLDAWKQKLAASPLAGGPGEFKPLIVDGVRLYLARYWLYEKNLADKLLDRGSETCDEVDLDRLKNDLDRLFSHNVERPDWQRAAAAIAVLRRFSVVSGGPGTGKTSTVVRILAALQAQAEGGLRIALAAPTGKAAARMQDSIRAQKQKLDLPEAIVASIPENASTLHRLLGSRPDSVYFRHGRDNPLSVDVVVVDEASMIDLALMAKLVDALPKRARLILLGDKDQLAAVEAGAVFGDICSGRGYSPAFLSQLGQVAGLESEAVGQEARSLSGGAEQPFAIGREGGGEKFVEELNSQVSKHSPGFPPPSQPSPCKGEGVTASEWEGGNDRLAGKQADSTKAKPVQESAKPLGDCIALLSKSHRFGGDSGIGELARRVNAAEDSLPVLDLLRSGRYADIVWRDRFTEAELLRRMDEGYRAYFEAVDGGAGEKEVLAALNLFRVLAAHREGPASAASANLAFEAVRRARLRTPNHERWYAGRPIIITRNDYGVRLFNGDVGVCLRVEGELRVCFEDADGKLRSLAPARLPEHEPVYAMTVHKSQGSEFDEALLLLPETASPVLNRPLVYTAITRAKRRAEIWGAEAVLAVAVKSLPERGSGLRERLWGE